MLAIPEARALVGASAASQIGDWLYNAALLGYVFTATRSAAWVVEVNARMGGGRIHQVVEAVWGVDLIEAQLRSSLDLRQHPLPSRKPRCTVVNSLLYGPATGRLAALPLLRNPPVVVPIEGD